MLPRDRAEQILADYAAGKPVREIAEAYGHSITTIRTYAHGLRTPGEPAARADDFAPFAGYCRQRLADDPHLRTPALLAELSGLGLDSSRATLYRALERHGIQTHPCPGCRPASMSGYSPLAAARSPQPSPLPVPAAPVAGEALASFLGRLAAANRTSPMPCWKSSRPGSASRPAGTTTAGSPPAVHLPAHHQVCLRHGIWLSAPGTPQFSVSGCPDILVAERHARRLLRRCTVEQLIYARAQAAADQADHAWKPS